MKTVYMQVDEKKNGWWEKDQNERHYPSSSKVKPPLMKKHCKFVIIVLSITKY